MSWARWKAAEKEVAEYFGGHRRLRVQYDERIGDIIHPTLSIEVKYGKCIPKYLQINNSTTLCVGTAVYLLTLSTQEDILKTAGIYEVKKKKQVVFLEQAFNQAQSYNPTLEPVVCVKAAGMTGFIIVKRLKF